MRNIKEGLIFNDSWFSPGEGMFTALAKICCANRCSARTVARSVFLKNSLPDGVLSPGFSLLSEHWIKKAILARTGGIAEQLSEMMPAGLPTYFRDLVMSKKRFRYCQRCLDMGYQSYICQIDAMYLCPVHDCVLLDGCQGCNAPTGAYELGGKSNFAMLCNVCGKPMGGCWADAFHSWSNFDVSAYRRLALILPNIKNISFYEMASWKAYFQCFAPHKFNSALFGHILNVLDIRDFNDYVVPEVLGRPSRRLLVPIEPTPAKTTWEADDGVCQYVKSLQRQEERYQKNVPVALDAFKSVRDQHLASIDEQRMLKVEWSHLRYNPHASVVVLVNSCDHEVFAHHLFCNKFLNPAKWYKPIFRPSALSIATDILMDFESWREFFSFAYEAELRFAKYWCELTEGWPEGGRKWLDLFYKLASILDASVNSSACGLLISKNLNDAALSSTGYMFVSVTLASDFQPMAS